MKSNWSYNTLENLCVKIFSGGTPSTKDNNFWNGKLHWLSSGETGNRFIRNTEKRITQSGVENSSTKLAQKKDIVIASAGQGHTRGQTSICEIDTYINQSIIALRPDKMKMDPYFLFYNLSGRYNELRHISDSNSSRGSLTTKIIKELQIYTPPLEEQQRIASILLSLDNKIYLNNQIISNLEELAQSLFKSWFEDFEFPNDSGEPYKSSGGEMVESKLGLIPNSWRVGNAGDMFEFAPKTTLKKGKEATFVEMKNLESSAMIYEWTKRDFTGSGSKFINGDTLLARITPCLENGKIGFVDFLSGNDVGWGSTEFIPIRSKLPISPVYSYFFTSQTNFKNYAISNLNGSSGRQRVSAATLSVYSTMIPPHHIIKRYTDIVEPFMVKMRESRNENKLLTSLRETLLPKLMSGEV